jgi:hypothetical protein
MKATYKLNNFISVRLLSARTDKLCSTFGCAKIFSVSISLQKSSPLKHSNYQMNLIDGNMNNLYNLDISLNFASLFYTKVSLSQLISATFFSSWLLLFRVVQPSHTTVSSWPSSVFRVHWHHFYVYITAVFTPRFLLWYIEECKHQVMITILLTEADERNLKVTAKAVMVHIYWSTK